MFIRLGVHSVSVCTLGAKRSYCAIIIFNYLLPVYIGWPSRCLRDQGAPVLIGFTFKCDQLVSSRYISEVDLSYISMQAIDN